MGTIGVSLNSVSKLNYKHFRCQLWKRGKESALGCDYLHKVKISKQHSDCKLVTCCCCFIIKVFFFSVELSIDLNHLFPWRLFKYEASEIILCVYVLKKKKCLVAHCSINLNMLKSIPSILGHSSDQKS